MSYEVHSRHYTSSHHHNSVLGARKLTSLFVAFPGENAAILYSLPETGDATAFRIDQRTGRIIASEVLDRERKSQYIFKVTAQDQAKENPLSSTTEVVINVLDTNDHKPELLGGTHFNISENMPANTFITNLKARDLDQGRNGQVVFSMDRQLAYDYFVLRQWVSWCIFGTSPSVLYF